MCEHGSKRINNLSTILQILKVLILSGMKPILDGFQIPFIFKSGGNGPGMGCRADGTVVARASLPEFATRKVVNSNDIYPTAIYRYSSRPSQRLDVWKFSGRIRPSRIIPSNLFCLGIKR